MYLNFTPGFKKIPMVSLGDTLCLLRKEGFPHLQHQWGFCKVFLWSDPHTAKGWDRRNCFAVLHLTFWEYLRNC